MRFLGIEYEMKSRPALDASFVPFGVWEKAYLEQAGREFALAVEREGGKISVFRSRLRGPEFAEANLVYVERLVKFMLYAVGGFRIWLCGCDDIAEKLKEIYSSRGARSFDVGFVGDVYERPLEICAVDAAHFPEAHEEPEAIGGHLDGCRIGLDAGGSDRKVSAVIDGETYLGVLSFTGYGLELPVLAQWDFEALRQAPAVYAGSVAGNELVIAAHNYRSHFSVLNRMVVGNEVVLTDPAGHALRYVVRKIEVLPPTAIEEMTAGEWDLTLFTCTYGGKTRQTLRCERMM